MITVIKFGKTMNKIFPSLKHPHLKQFLLLCLALVISQSLWAKATATLKRSEIYENESFELIVSIDESQIFFGDEPDLSPLEKDFDILGQSKSSQTSYINGKKQASTSWHYTLQAKQVGLFTLPAINVGKEKTEALRLKVKPAQQYTANNNSQLQAAFIESEIDKTESYVQEQLLLTIRFNTALNLQNIKLSPLDLQGAELIEVSNHSYQRQIQGTPFNTFELQYALFPQKSGELIIPPIIINAEQHDNQSRRSLFSRGKPVRIKGEALSVQVKPFSDQFKHTHWLPAKKVQLHETFSQDPQSIMAGDAITRTVIISAEQASSAQLPDVSIANSPIYKVYPEQATLDEQNNKAGVQGIYAQKSQSFSIVASQAGEITLPEIQVPWFNTQTQSTEIASLPALTLHIKANPALQGLNKQTGTPSSSAPTSRHADNTNIELSALKKENAKLKQEIGMLNTKRQQESDKLNQQTEESIAELKHKIRWLSIGLALSVIFLFVSIIAYIKRPKLNTTSEEKPPEKTPAKRQQALQALQAAIQSSDLVKIKATLLAYAKSIKPQQDFYALADLHTVISSEQGKQTLQCLDAALYQGQAQPSVQVLEALMDELQVQSNTSEQAGLASLYPH